MGYGYREVTVMKAIILMTKKMGKVNLHGLVVTATLVSILTI
jgi:hypothetical protein